MVEFPDHLDRQVGQLRHRAGGRVQVHVVLEPTDLGGAGRQHQVLQVDGVEDVGRGQPLGLQHARVQVHHHLPLLAPERERDGHAPDRHELGAQEVDAEIEELLLGQPFPGQRQLEDRHAGGAEVDDQRRPRPGRVLAQHGLGDGGDLGVGGVQARVRLQVHLDDGLPVDGGGLDALDVVHRGREHALVRGRDPPFQLLGVQPGVLPGHRDDRDVDRGEDVGGRARDDDRTGDQDQEREDDEGVRPIQRDPDDPHERGCA